jgi:hypothetical protein
MAVLWYYSPPSESVRYKQGNLSHYSFEYSTDVRIIRIVCGPNSAVLLESATKCSLTYHVCGALSRVFASLYASEMCKGLAPDYGYAIMRC